MVRTLRSRPVENGGNADGIAENEFGFSDPSKQLFTELGTADHDDLKLYAYVDPPATLVVGGLDQAFMRSLEGSGSAFSFHKRDLDSEQTADSPRKRRRIDYAAPLVSTSPRTRSKGSLENAPSSARNELLPSTIEDSMHSQTSAREKASPTPDESPQKRLVPQISDPLDDAQDDIIVVRPNAYVPRSEVSSPARSPTVESSSPSPSRDELAEAASATPRRATDPNELNESDLPPPFLPRGSRSPSPSTFTEHASYLQAAKFAPIPPPSRFIGPLTSHDPADRSTETLRTLAFNVQRALRAWQDEYIALDKHTAPMATNPPKKPATGGRIPVTPSAFDAAKEVDLFAAGGLLAALKPKSRVNAPSAAPSHAPSHAVAVSGDAGRELRRRHADASIIDGLGISDDDAGATTSREKRPRRPVRRFEWTLLGDDGDTGSDGPIRTRGRGRGSTNTTGRGRGRGSGRGRGTTRSVYLSATPEGGDTMSNGDDDPAYGQRTPLSRRATAARARANRGGRGSRGKSEKRSESMTAWWAARKKKAAEEKRLRELKEQGLLVEGEHGNPHPLSNARSAAPAAEHAVAAPSLVRAAPSAPAAAPSIQTIHLHPMPPSHIPAFHGYDDWRMAHAGNVHSYTTEVYNSPAGTPAMTEPRKAAPVAPQSQHGGTFTQFHQRPPLPQSAAGYGFRGPV